MSQSREATERPAKSRQASSIAILEMDTFGPWARGISADERRARWRSLLTVATMFLGKRHALAGAIRVAELDPAAAPAALAQLETLAPRLRRRILALYQSVHDGPGGSPRAEAGR